MMKQQTESRIPRFQAYEEEAEFWDAHDTAEFENEFEPVEATFAKPLIKRVLTVPLDEQEVQQLRSVARQKHTDPAALARNWILDQLRLETARTT